MQTLSSLIEEVQNPECYWYVFLFSIHEFISFYLPEYRQKLSRFFMFYMYIEVEYSN